MVARAARPTQPSSWRELLKRPEAMAASREATPVVAAAATGARTSPMPMPGDGAGAEHVGEEAAARADECRPGQACGGRQNGHEVERRELPGRGQEHQNVGTGHPATAQQAEAQQRRGALDSARTKADRSAVAAGHPGGTRHRGPQGQARWPATGHHRRHAAHRLRRRAGGEPVEQIQPDLIIPTGKRKGQSPSVASIYRALAEHEKARAYSEAIEAAHADFVVLQDTADVPHPRPARTLASFT